MDLTLYQETVSEKIERISDILIQMNKLSILKDHMSFYGGTALNFLYLDAPRLSEDLDFNYRQTDSRDWGEVRSVIDKETKRILSDLDYSENDIKIQPTYNLCRFYIQYLNSKNLKDFIKIETGYMRRIPILKNDTFKEFIHPATEKRVKIKTPRSEELFANKFCTLFSREETSSRDIFDVYNISKEKFDLSLFCDIVMIESLFMKINIDSFPMERFNKKKQGDRIRDLVVKNFDWKILSQEVISFIERIQSELSTFGYSEFIREFERSHKIDIDALKNKNKINKGIQKHPIILWMIEEESSKI